MLIISYGLQIFKLVTIIANLSFYLGIGWIIFCDLNQKSVEKTENGEYQEFFLDYFELRDRPYSYQAIVAAYYMFTSLSTVGFGDYNPRSDNERLVCLAILLFGVSIFSYVMSAFMEIVNQYSVSQKELEDYDNLIVFFSMFTRFNGGKPIKVSI